ncbi:MAG: hypothetical protein J6N47_05120 [Lachnospiraceae bacterium]|nr:hypothetical protein [Lachnospiraceae bacterium]
MKFDELLAKVRGMAEKVDASGKDFLAVQVNITGKDSGVFKGIKMSNGAFVTITKRIRKNSLFGQ